MVLAANAAAQPCATMAEEHDCPHCPPEHHESGHPGHGEMRSKPCCEALQAPCGELDDANVDGRTGLLKPLDAAESPVLIAQAYPSFACERRGILARATGPPRCAVTSPPIHVLNCVYLD